MGTPVRDLDEAELRRRVDLGDEAREELRRRAIDREPTLEQPLPEPDRERPRSGRGSTEGAR